MSSEEALERDWSLRPGMLSGKAARLADWHHRRDAKAFAKLVASLRVRKWRQDRPELAKAIAQRQAAREKLERAARGPDAQVFTCALCGATWCRLSRRFWARPGPIYCSPEHGARARYLELRENSTWRRSNSARAQAWQEANPERRRANARSYARKQRRITPQ